MAEKIVKDSQGLVNDLVNDTVSRKAAIDAICKSECGSGFCGIPCPEVNVLKALPSAQSKDWMERNKERILQAGIEGREIEFRIGGRLFAIREKAQ